MAIQTFDFSKMRRGALHIHYCAGCGDHFCCRADRDKCAIPEPFECLNCAEEARSIWLETNEQYKANHGRDVQDTF